MKYWGNTIVVVMGRGKRLRITTCNPVDKQCHGPSIYTPILEMQIFTGILIGQLNRLYLSMLVQSRL